MGVSLRGGKDIAMVSAHVSANDLELLSELIEAGKVRPEIDPGYPFAEIPAAIAYLEEGTPGEAGCRSGVSDLPRARVSRRWPSPDGPGARPLSGPGEERG